MPKIKTRRGAAKRFSMTGSGRIKRRKAYLRHQLTMKTRKQKRNLGKATTVSQADMKAVRRMLPNG
ncbi:MAG: 50S ribosomal protein L35 [Deltaproteobacteria bacterium]|jgi:large subunit ribosomal protein L35